MHRVTTSICLFLAMASGTIAGEPPSDGGKDAPLSGPKVVDRERPKTLVERDASGALVRIEQRPEVAALALLTLTPEEKLATDRIVLEHQVAVGRALDEHMAMFLEYQGVRQSANREKMRELAPKFRQAMGALLSPSLIDRVAGALPKEKSEGLRGYVDEYLQAEFTQQSEQRGGAEGERRPTSRKKDDRPGEDGMMPSPRKDVPMQMPKAMRERQEANLLMREMARTLSSIVQERTARMDAALKAAEATPEQEARIKAIVRETSSPTKPPTPAEREQTTRKILAELGPEQGRKFLQALRG